MSFTHDYLHTSWTIPGVLHFFLVSIYMVGRYNDYGTYTAIDSRVTASYMVVISRFSRRTDIFLIRHDTDTNNSCPNDKKSYSSCQ